jgi:hypothetical protein
VTPSTPEGKWPDDPRHEFGSTSRHCKFSRLVATTPCSPQCLPQTSRESCQLRPKALRLLTRRCTSTGNGMGLARSPLTGYLLLKVTPGTIWHPSIHQKNRSQDSRHTAPMATSAETQKGTASLGLCIETLLCVSHRP